MQYLGDYLDDYATLNFTFHTFRWDTGASTTLANTPVISVYKGSATGTEKTSAESYITLDVDFDTKTGLNHVLINLGGDGFFVAGQDYYVVITTGTVNSIDVIGTVVAHFSIENRSQQVMNAAILVDTAAIVVGTIDNAAGADVATDVVAMKVDTAAVVVGTIDNATGADVATDVVAMKAETVNILADTDDIGTAGAGLTALAQASIVTEARLAELDAGNLIADVAGVQTTVDAIEVGTITNATGDDVASDVVALKAETVLILADTDDIGVAGAGLTDLGGMSDGMKAEVNVEAKDVLDTDTHAEPGQGAPGATISTGAKIDLLYQSWRNKKTQTATLETLFLDNGSTEGSRSIISDNATTATKAERTTGV